ncbi:MAG: oligosaccharide flippase family protein [Alphaproteobacteria bacterium]|nr:oligosaccharide flippase family protein [Alphaproteobacteria bacterium]
MELTEERRNAAMQTHGATRFARNSGFGVIAGASTALGSFLMTVIVAHLLGVADTGVFAFALWVVLLVSSLADLGSQASLARYVPELMATGDQEQVSGLVKFLFRPLACGCGVVLIGFVGCVLWMSGGDEVPQHARLIWILVGLACALQPLAAFSYAYLRGMQRFDRVALLTVASFFVQLAGVMTGAVTAGVAGALAGYCTGLLLPAAISWRTLRPGSRFSNGIRARVMRYAFYAWAAGLASSFVWSRIEVFFLQRSVGSEAVGLFTVGLTLSNLATQGPMLLTAGLLPYFAENFGKNAFTKIRDGYATATRMLAFLVLPACFGMAAIMPAALPLIYGQAFAGAVPAATVLVVAAAIGATSSVGANLVNALDRSDFICLSGLLAATLTIAAGLSVIPAFGLMGAAWARAAIQISAVALGCWFVSCRLRCPLPLNDLARLLLAAALCAVAARASLAVLSGAARLPLAILSGIGTYIAAVRGLRALPPADAARLTAFVRRLPAGVQETLSFGLRLVCGPAAVSASGASGGKA